MSTTGNENERPGVNYPDRKDADGATDTPGDNPLRDQDAAGDAAVSGEDAAAAGEKEARAQDSGIGGAPAAFASEEPSHTAVGIGVVDDGTDHHGQDGPRDTLTVSEAQQTPGALGTEQEQRLPAMDQNNASELDKVAGIVAQTRQDLGTESLERIQEVLQQRLEQSGIDLPEGDVRELAHQVSTGDAHSPTES
jgi:hypothetical protein